MIDLTVGLLYSAQEFLSLVKSSQIKADDFKEISSKFSLASPHEIFQLCQSCNWLSIDEGGICCLSEYGLNVVNAESEPFSLRIQLFDYIIQHDPIWAVKVRAGRREALAGFTDGALQIFKEAKLYNCIEDHTVDWWDKIIGQIYSKRAANNLSVGRLAERLSFQFEAERVGENPEWMGLESSYAGYDILSKINDETDSRLLIEVKGSALKLKDANFSVTRHEWQTAKRKKDYIFHLWVLGAVRSLFIVPMDEILPNIPCDQEKGRWSAVQIPFRLFKDFKSLELPQT